MEASLRQSILDFRFLLPELVLCFGAIMILLVSLWRNSFRISITITLLAGLVSLLLLATAGETQPQRLFSNWIVIDGLSVILRILMDIGLLMICLMTSGRQRRAPEYFMLMLFALGGAHLLVITGNFLLIFLTIEIISISTYALASYSFDKKGSEGGLKFFLFGSAASAVMLYGFSIWYGLSGSIDAYESAQGFLIDHRPMGFIAAMLILAGMLFKLGAFPLHFWIPDVYEAAPTSVTAFLSIVPKLAGLGVVIHFATSASTLFVDWQTILVWIALISIVAGNFGALKQTNFKRLMAYSSIAHSGFILLGVASYRDIGIPFTLFYATTYLLSTVLIFLYLAQFEKQGLIFTGDYKGQAKLHPLPMFCLLVGLVSLTGLPPTAGFTGKLFVFSSIWQAFEVSHRPLLLVLLITGLLNTVLSLFFYLRIPYNSYFKTGEPTTSQNIHLSVNFLGIILVVTLVTLFLYPTLLMGWINKINFVL